ncbi:unnamed protein product [Adineta steineri]|uniref:Uncharacterized protein n=1 Tax=Adineta steineri TaxID=433720 RepID=A0A818HJG4_9BILA|nr:unnamed protein product [Adineta steineri]CAF1229574.1 unnamed protein product [Adineta steineri]CAF3505221.1 unnamed protein product [Adineta steineri]CAF4093655.1 unnamed protein product [Adineta steineri]
MTASVAAINNNLGHIYRLIFHLSSLKYFKLRILNNQALNLKMPTAINEEFCYFKYLVICHPAFIDELISLLSYTPNLSHLYCYNIIETDNNMKLEELIKLTHLIHKTITTQSDDS